MSRAHTKQSPGHTEEPSKHMRPNRGLELLAGGSSWSRSPGYLRGILETMQRVAGFEPGPTLRASWTAGARRLYEELRHADIPEAQHGQFMEWAIAVMQKDKLVIKSPGSLVYLVPQFKGTIPKCPDC